MALGQAGAGLALSRAVCANVRRHPPARPSPGTARTPIQETAFSALFVSGKWFLVFDFGGGGMLSPYALATRCPVLTSRMAVQYRASVRCCNVLCNARVWLSGTDLAYGATLYCAVRGTDLAHGPTACYAMSGTYLAYGATRLDAPLSPSSISTTGTTLRACYAMSGTDLAYDATSASGVAGAKVLPSPLSSYVAAQRRV
eukprot:1689125-Rhodomonas_salina.1